jgi:hypothetical protein
MSSLKHTALRNRAFESRRRGQHPQAGYLIVLFVIIMAFVGVLAAMQVLVLTSVGTTSRAYDQYRQGATEMTRLERTVVEAVLDEAQISVAKPPSSLAEAVSRHLGALSVGGATVTATLVPPATPKITTFPDSTATPDAIGPMPDGIRRFLAPELALMVGTRVAAYPEIDFEFGSERTVLDVTRTYRTQVRAKLLAVPLTRFAIAAYDLPTEIGSTAGAPSPRPASNLPAGLVPVRDVASVADLQGQAGVLPYHYRRRATLAAAYQYVFSQAYLDRVAEYAGITHYRNLDVVSGTATLAGMSQFGATTNWDIGTAGDGTYGTVTLARDAAVVFTEHAGNTLRLYDSVGSGNSTALLLVLLGPADAAVGALTVDISSIARPVVIIGYNVRVTASANVAINGALFLDPASALAPSGPLTLGHLSYWAGTTKVPENAVVTTALPIAAEAIAPRVIYVATNAVRL